MRTITFHMRGFSGSIFSAWQPAGRILPEMDVWAISNGAEIGVNCYQSKQQYNDLDEVFVFFDIDLEYEDEVAFLIKFSDLITIVDTTDMIKLIAVKLSD